MRLPCRVRSHGLRIIKTLLDNFPAYKVIFRPSFQDTDEPEVKELLAVFGNEPRFVFDADPGQVFCFQHAAAMVTDLSNVVSSFAFSTLRPGIFFKPWQSMDGLFYRNSFGFSTCSYEGLVETVRLCTENAAEESARIAKNRSEQVMPIESAFDEIAQWLPNFYHDQPLPHWLTIERGSCVQTPDENGLVEKLSLVDAANAYLPSAVAAIHRYPESPLICAFALHCGFKHTPEIYIYGPLLEIISKHAGFKMPCIPYGKVYPHIIKNLYAKALEQKTERHDSAGIELVKKFMADLEDICAARGVED